MQIKVFDLDHTLLRVNCSFRFGLYLYQKGEVPTGIMGVLLSYYALHKAGGLTLAQLHHKIFKLFFFQLPSTQILQHAKEFVSLNFNSILYPPAIQVLTEAQRNNEYTILLSSAPQFLVQLFAEYFLVNEWSSTEYAIDEDLRFSRISKLMLSDQKADYVRQVSTKLNIPLQQISAYSDSFLDLSFLQTAGQAVAVNPDRKLRAFSKKHHWPTL